MYSIKFIARMLDSDIEMSDSAGASSIDLSSDSDTNEGDDDYSEEEIVGYRTDFDKEWRNIGLTVETADPVCQRLNRLIQDGKIPRDKILYKYLNEMVEVFYNPRHAYDDDAKEFFASLAYLGGKRTYNMVRGPMFAGQGRGLPDRTKMCKMNLGGPSEETLCKKQAAYTVKSRVHRHLSLLNYQLAARCESNKATPLIDSSKLLVFPVALGNYGTALKPAIQFDERKKSNVGLSSEIDMQFVRDNPFVDSDTLKKELVCEALVSSISTLDNKYSMPVSARYSPKSGKTGDYMKKMLTEEIKILQMCENCQKRSKESDLILPAAQLILCKSECIYCIQSKTVCEDCAKIGCVTYIPSVRPCKFCLEHDLKCVLRVVTVLTLDCEEGNKKCMVSFKEAVISGSVDPASSLLTVLPDAPHVLKTLKASFSNWPLQLGSERGNLYFLCTLRNRAEPEV